MIAVRKKKNGFGAMLAVSTTAHLVFYLLLTYFYFPHEMKVTEQVCYVDMVNLPVESPRQGAPAPAPPAPEATPPAPSPALPEPALPKPAGKTSKQQKTPAQAVPANGRGPTAKKPADAEPQPDEFQKRIAQLQEEREYEKRLESLRKRTEPAKPSASAPAGIPTGTGTQSGSDYTSYIHSRLKDAFAQTMTTSGKSPEAVVQLSIDRFGNVSGIRFEKTSGDKLFDDSVMRAIALAKKNFPAPPGGIDFRANFIFRPQGVGKK